jgi:sodium-dependent dicarboxylate transporter 2/3/5
MMDWRTASRLPWGVLLLFGGGLSLASAMSATKLDAYVGTLFEGLRGVPPVVMTLVIVAAVVFLSELASNTALTATMLPVMKGAEDRLGLAPGTLIVPMTMAASCGFMLPVATPPNALAFATGQAPLRSMIRAGFWLDVVGIGVIVLVTSVLGSRAVSG